MMKTGIAAALLALTALTTACASEPAEPSPREQACETFKAVTPGFFEMSWSTKVLADTNASSADRLEAMKISVNQMSSNNRRTEPYTCDEPAFDRYLQEEGIN